MNKTLLYISALASAFTLGSCVDFDDVTNAATVSVQVEMPSDFIATDYEGHTVTLSQNGTNRTYTAQTDASGVARFEGVVPDVYSVSTSWEITPAQYITLTGDNSANDGASVTGLLSNCTIGTTDGEISVTLGTNLAVNRSLVIGKIYYAGCKNNDNKNYRADQYVELYNQSNDTIDLADFYFGLTDSGNSYPWTAEHLTEVHQDSTAMSQVFAFPSTATTTLAPGGTAVIALSAINHTTVASSSFDLTIADFDFNDTRTKNAYTNNPAVPDMELVYTYSASLAYMNMMLGGQQGVCVFRKNSAYTTWSKTYPYSRTSGSEFVLIPNADIIDAVDMIKHSATGNYDTTAKRFVSTLDAGFVTVTATNGYTGEVLYRKTSSRTGTAGQKILQDTNNSSNDFSRSTTIQPRQYE